MSAQCDAIDPISLLNWKKKDIAKAVPLRVNWDALQQYALRLRQPQWQGSTTPSFSTCVLLPQYTMGGLHLVRLVEFDDGNRWVVRIQLHGGTHQSSQRLIHEVHTLSLVREKTDIPAPRVFGFESTTSNPVGVPFFLMEFIPGNTAMDAFGGYDVHHGEIPAQYKSFLIQQTAKIQVGPRLLLHRRSGSGRAFANVEREQQTEMASIRFPKIGRVIRRDDGSYAVGPFPDLGGPFSTAAEYFKAWAQHAKFPWSESQQHRRLPKGLGNEIRSSIQDFPCRLAVMAGRVSLGSGPFPLYHPDFRHSNLIVDTDCNILSVIDWEDASTVPWEAVEFPLFLSTTPPPMDAPWNYDDEGLPIDPSVRQVWDERDEYVRFVREAEVERGLDQCLSTTLANRTVQNLAGALKLFLDPGKIGFYCKVLEQFSADAESFHNAQANDQARFVQNPEFAVVRVLVVLVDEVRDEGVQGESDDFMAEHRDAAEANGEGQGLDAAKVAQDVVDDAVPVPVLRPTREPTCPMPMTSAHGGDPSRQDGAGDEVEQEAELEEANGQGRVAIGLTSGVDLTGLGPTSTDHMQPYMNPPRAMSDI
ncbi:Uncharacterized protein TPAR_06618, partial [Tolypocladium paradoxum]